MLEATARLIQLRGYYGTSLNEILQESAAPRGSLYFHFPGGKDQLVLEATRNTVNEVTAFLTRALSGADSPATGTSAYFAAAAELMVKTDYEFGCPVAPIILDANASLTELADVCRGAFETWTDLLADSYHRAGAPPDRASDLALLVSAALEGALLISRSYRSPEPILTVADTLRGILESTFVTTDEGEKSAALHAPVN